MLDALTVHEYRTQRQNALGLRVLAATTRFLLVAFLLTPGSAVSDEPIVFNRDIRPILSDKCLHCHGADENTRDADLRLDDPEDVRSDRGGYQVVVSGNPSDSELYLRIISDDEDERMPPEDSAKQLSESETELIRRWIEQGAEYQEHWSFIPPTRPIVPATPNTQVRNAIDHFVLAGLNPDHVNPAEQADRATLIRRVSLDLTGLPPTPQEVDAFLADDSVKAYETVVERLLDSNRYGEHFARYWLDAARYADSNGYFTDQGRTMWPWRDWVIDAFNDNMPFDQFTIEQLAGDLLPSSPKADDSLEGDSQRSDSFAERQQRQKIASGFNRNHMVNNETGIDQEEFRIEYVADRIKTTGTVWMGLTIGCARCHDHKFDPLSQRDFYRFFAFFNQVPENGLDGSQGNAAPLLRIPSRDQKRQLIAMDKELAMAKTHHAPIQKSLQVGQKDWEKQAAETTSPAPTKGLLVRFPLDRDAQGEGLHPVCGRVPQEDFFVEGVLGGAVQLGHGEPVETLVDLPIRGDKPFSLGVWGRPKKDAGCVVSQTNDAEAFRGFDLSLRKGLLQFHLIHRWKDDAIEVATVEKISTRKWQHYFVTYDGSGKASGVRIYIDGKLQAVTVNVDNLRGDITNSEPLRIGRRKSSASFEGEIDDLCIYDHALSEKDVLDLATGQLIRGTLARDADKRDRVLAEKLTEYYIHHHAKEANRHAHDRLVSLQDQRDQFYESIPITMVMQEMKEPRDTFVLERGVYDQHGEVVTAGIPASLGEFPDGEPLNRLGLAHWLTSDDHPLTARVTVNRLWQQFFGTGIVKTAEDFGTQGAWPSHPELLDWLAVEFVENGWDVKQLVRLIVQSATYRQSSNATPTEFLADPLNEKLARGPRFRLDAEAVRDQALAISGLLAEKMGGPSVKPYQPPGLWKSVSYDANVGYELSTGRDLHRRSLYSYWKRQSPPPNMLTFDAGTRETCCVRRSRTNTPLQALVLMNDPVFVEAAQALAKRTLAETPKSSVAQRARYAFRLATSRFPDTEELKIMTVLYEKQLKRFQSNPEAANQLLGIKGLGAKSSELLTAQLAAWTTVSNLILCLDETITKR